MPQNVTAMIYSVSVL